MGFFAGYRLTFTSAKISPGAAAFLFVFTALSIHWLVATADAWLDAAPGTRSGKLFAWAGPVAAALAMWDTGWFSVLNAPTGARESPTRSIRPTRWRTIPSRRSW